MKQEPILYSQVIPLTIAFGSGLLFLLFLFFNVNLSNHIFPITPIRLTLGFADLALGFYLYIKTSVDFAAFIGSMMVSNPGWKNRVAVEWGTSLGNFAGTLVVLWLWMIFRSTNQLLEGLIVLIASFVLLELAAGSHERLREAEWDVQSGFKKSFFMLSKFFLKLRLFTEPFLVWMPDLEATMSGKSLPTIKSLLLYSFIVPFILGSDDFASYISVFSVVNVFSFATGVIIGHSILLAGLFAFPKKVDHLLALPGFSALAITTFILLFLNGAYDAVKILWEWSHSSFINIVIILSLGVLWWILYTFRHHFIIPFTSWLKTRLRALEILNREGN